MCPFVPGIFSLNVLKAHHVVAGVSAVVPITLTSPVKILDLHSPSVS